MRIRTILFFLLCLGMLATGRAGALEKVPEPFDPIEREGRTLRTTRHRLSVAPTGLPAGIFVRSQPHELPLNARGEEPSDALLRTVGRGPQLRAPLRIEATVEGTVVETEVTGEASVIEENDAEVAYRSTLEAGPFAIDLTTRYQFDGGMVAQMTYRGGGEGAESLELVMDLVGPVTQAWRGPRTGKDGIEAVAGLDPSLPSDTGEVVWDSAEHSEVLGRDGSFVPYLHFGNPDRFFTWLSDGPKGWTVDPAQPMVTIERDKAGRATWRARFVNHVAESAGGKTVRFALLTHPARPRPAGFRRRQWFGWPEEAKRLSVSPGDISLKRRRKLLRAAAGRDRPAVLDALGGGTLEAAAHYLQLSGESGGALLSRERDNVALFPAGLFSVFAGTSTGLSVRVRSNVRRAIRPGAAPRYDRQILGRALVHDIGVAPGGMSQPAQYARVVRALARFEFFQAEQIEVLPYWRNDSVVRYGEEFTRGNAFELTRENPAAGVYVTVYRRPRAEDGYEAIFVVMNERDNPVRERLFVLDPARLFGTRNGLTAPAITKMTDFSAIPDDSDWRQSKIANRMGGREREAYALMDLEDNGVVLYSESKGMDANIYGPLFIRPHNFKILYGVSE
jgi:hypothetical protein